MGPRQGRQEGGAAGGYAAPPADDAAAAAEDAATAPGMFLRGCWNYLILNPLGIFFHAKNFLLL